MPDRQTIADVEARLDRLADFAAGFDCDVQTHVVDKAVAVQHAADLTALLASHRKMREALEPFADDYVKWLAEDPEYKGREFTVAELCAAASALQGDADAPR